MLVYVAAVPPDLSHLPIRSLSSSTAEELTRSGADIAVPDYDRSALRPSILHVGVGGFHRAHLATYIDELCRAGHTRWGIVGAGTLPSDVAIADALAGQDHLYTLLVRDNDNTTAHVIGSIIDFVRAYEDPDAFVARVAAPETQIVSLTVTEGGYPVDDQTGRHLPASPNAGETSAFGLIARGLEARRAQHGSPITILSCDNVMKNGAITRAAVCGEAERFGDELLAWIGSSVSFPNGMVDRITPATTPTDRAWLRTHLHLDDAWPVVTEPFRQWVIEDDFAGDRPPLEELDILVTNDVEPYEIMKLRLLNASHSCLAYPAALLGIEHVHTAMEDADILVFVQQLLAEEAVPALPDVPGIDIDAYVASLTERFANPAIGDQIARLTQDGSSKFPKFLLPTIEAGLASGGSIERCTFALAAWCEYLAKSTDADSGITASMDARLGAAQAAATASLAEPAAFLGFADVFPDHLRTNERFASTFVSMLTAIRTEGTRTVLTRLVGDSARP